jgi:hypothetical protein
LLSQVITNVVFLFYSEPSLSCYSDLAFFAYGAREIDENALEQALSAAVTCTILAGAGPQRSRVLATLYKVLTRALFMIENNECAYDSRDIAC